MPVLHHQPDESGAPGGSGRTRGRCIPHLPERARRTERHSRRPFPSRWSDLQGCSESLSFLALPSLFHFSEIDSASCPALGSRPSVRLCFPGPEDQLGDFSACEHCGQRAAGLCGEGQRVPVWSARDQGWAVRRHFRLPGSADRHLYCECLRRLYQIGVMQIVVRAMAS